MSIYSTLFSAQPDISINAAADEGSEDGQDEDCDDDGIPDWEDEEIWDCEDVSDDDRDFACEFLFAEHAQGTQALIQCGHDELAAGTVYTVEIDGLVCEDGRAVSAESWQFLTEA